MAALQDLATDKIATIIELAEAQAKALKSVKTHQLRNVFAAISKMRMDYKQQKMNVLRSLPKGALTDEAYEKQVGDLIYKELQTTLLFMKPKIAYAAGRIREVRPFYDFMKEAIDAVDRSSNKKKALTNFFMMMESIVAYHKFYE